MYLALAVLCYIVIFISYKRPQSMSTIIWMTNIYITLRLSFRNIETMLIYDKDVWGEYYKSLVFQSFAIFFSMIFLINSFESTITGNIFTYLTILMSSSSILVGMNKGTDGLSQNVKILVIGMIGLFFIFRIMQQVLIESFSNFMSKID